MAFTNLNNDTKKNLVKDYPKNKLSKYKINVKNFDNFEYATKEIKNDKLSLNIITVNIASLRNKYDLIRIMLNDFSKVFDIITLIETKYIDNKNNIDILLNNYNNIVVQPKLNKCGGMIIFIKNDIVFKEMVDIKINDITVIIFGLKYLKIIFFV
jgi:hypothetical protein